MGSLGAWVLSKKSIHKLAASNSSNSTPYPVANKKNVASKFVTLGQGTREHESICRRLFSFERQVSGGLHALKVVVKAAVWLGISRDDLPENPHKPTGTAAF